MFGSYKDPASEKSAEVESSEAESSELLKDLKGIRDDLIKQNAVREQLKK
jgi:hypothetical protein